MFYHFSTLHMKGLNDKAKTIKWVTAFKNGLRKICGRQPLKNLKWYGLLRQILLGPFLNNLIQMQLLNLLLDFDK